MIALISDNSSFDLASILIPLVVISLSMAIPIVAIITEHLQKKERMRLIEKAIEHGASLDSLNMDDPEPTPRLPYRSGMIMVAVGAALIVGDHFVGINFGNIHLPLVVGGLITGFIGIALLLNDWLNRDKLQK